MGFRLLHRHTVLPVYAVVFAVVSANIVNSFGKIEAYSPDTIGYNEEDIDNKIENIQLENDYKFFNFLRPHVPKKKSARYTELTKAIGQSSNNNLMEYERLTAMGMPKILVLNLLKPRRHPSCYKPVAYCLLNTKYRNIDGSCNNFVNPYWGASYTPFLRLFPAQYSDGYNKPKGFSPQKPLPNARVISSTVHPDLIHPDPTLTNMVPQIGQFLDHDFALTIEEDRECCRDDKNHKDCFPIEIPQDDYFYSNVSKPQTCMPFTRSTSYCFPSDSGMREQFNIDTSYVDASQVYGSENERMRHLREFRGGRLQMKKDNPKLITTVEEVEIKYKTKLDFMGKYLAGDNRVNEMPALTVMHTLWVREHNRVADDIALARPKWNDETIFQEARRIVIAQWQNVIFGQFLTTVLGPETMTKYSLDLGPEDSFSEYDASLDATLFHYFATAAYRFGHTLLNGLIRLVRDFKEVGSYLVRDNYFDSTQIERNNSQGYDFILGGLMSQNAQTYDRYVSVDFTNFLLRNKSDDYGADLVARNIQRSRDHAIPNYNTYREVCGLKPLVNWEERPDEILEETWTKLKSVYESPEDIELFPGGISEVPLKEAVSGNTFNCLKAMQFRRLKFGDRFFFTHKGQAGSLTPLQLSMIRKRTLGDIICENSNVGKTTVNVFRTASDDTNPWKNCDDNTRSRIDVNQFLPN